MLTFFEFYETLLGFVLFKLYGELGIRYPLVTATSGAEGDGKVANNPSLHPTIGGKATSVLAANLNALQVAMHQAQQGNSAVDAIGDALQKTATEEENDENAKDKKSTKAERKKQKKLMLSIDEALKGVKDDDDDSANGDDDEEMDEEDNVPIAAPLREALEAISDNNGNNTSDNDTEFVITDPEAQRRHQLFRNLTFFLSREVPRGYLELIILSFGGQVGWEGQDSPIAMDDPSITHHVVDRPALLPAYSKLPKSRDYIQPQWVMDSANFNFCLPIDKYGVGKTLPPHLSPWVDDKEEGYVPKYKEEIERLKNGEVLTNEDDAGAGGVVLKDSESEQEENVSASDEEEVQPQVDDDVEKGSSDESDSSEGDEEDDEDVETKAAKKTQAEVSCSVAITVMSILYHITYQFLLSSNSQDDEAAKLAKALMSKKAARLYDRMQHGKAQQQAKVDNLHKKRREIESTREKSKDGLTVTKQKVLRLKKERKEVEDSYGEGVGGGSMKKKKRRKN
jgi:pescadillo protein